MARKPRDYAAEYRRRIESAQRRGLSLSQARGHPRAGEPSARQVRSASYARSLAQPMGRGPGPTPEQQMLRRTALAQRARGEKPRLNIPPTVLAALPHAVRQFIFGY